MQRAERVAAVDEQRWRLRRGDRRAPQQECAGARVPLRPTSLGTFLLGGKKVPLRRNRTEIPNEGNSMVICPLSQKSEIFDSSPKGGGLKAPLCKGGWQKSLIFDWGIVDTIGLSLQPLRPVCPLGTSPYTGEA